LLFLQPIPDAAEIFPTLRGHHLDQVISDKRKEPCEGKLGTINRLVRRNLTPIQVKHLIGIEYNLEKKGLGQRGPEKSGQNDHSFKTEEIIAERHGISPKPVRHVGKFAEEMKERPPEERTAALDGVAVKGR